VLPDIRNHSAARPSDRFLDGSCDHKSATMKPIKILRARIAQTLLTSPFETFIRLQMARYKRNQVEEAIFRLLEPKSLLPTRGPRSKLKRLLEADRALPWAAKTNETKFAFFSEEPPGRGVEIWFSSYEAFALLNGLRLMEHGWPQGLAVSIMRRVRLALEEQHKRILHLDPMWLFDKEAIRKNAREGDLAFDNQDPVLLTVVSGSAGPLAEQGPPTECQICQGSAAAHAFVRALGGGSRAVTMFELTTLAHRLSWELAKTEPHFRGRS
jgi:hypothetical protein